MKFNDINLYGVIKFNNSTGLPGQVIKYIDGIPTWSDPDPYLLNVPIKNVGNRFILVETVENEIDNGNKLLEAYASAVTLANEIGVSESERITILLSPGRYQFQSEFIISTSFIDLVGLSTNPENTVLYGDQLTATLYFDNVDCRIENLYLTPATLLVFIQTGDCFLRWKNIWLGQRGFFSEGNFAVSDLRGEFENIRVLNGGEFAYVGGSIDGIFKDIYFEGTCGSSFVSTNNLFIQGTFSNIVAENIVGNFLWHDISEEGVFSEDGMILNIKNLKLYNLSGDFLISRGTIFCNFENIYLNTLVNCNIIVSKFSIVGNIEDIEMEMGGTVLLCISTTFEDGAIPNQLIDLNIKNLNILSKVVSNYLLSSNTVTGNYSEMKVSGVGRTFFVGVSLDIKIFDLEFFGDSGSTLFRGQTIKGDFEKIKAIGAAAIFASEGVTSGNFKNLYLSTSEGPSIAISTESFRAGSLEGIFKDIYIESATNSSAFIANGPITGNFENIKINYFNQYLQNSAFLGAHIKANIKKVKNFASSGFFQGSDTLDCIMEDVDYGQVDRFCSGGEIYGTYSNLRSRNTQNAKIFTIIGEGSSGEIDINLTDFVNFSESNMPEFLISRNDLRGKYKDIKISSLSTGFKSELGNINVDVEDMIITSRSNLFNALNGNISGNFKDIEFLNINSFVARSISGNYRNLYISANNGSSYFSFKANNGQINAKFDNVQLYDGIWGTFSGRIHNSIISSNNLLAGPLTITPQTVIENSDIYQINSSITSTYSIRSASGVGNISNATILNNGLIAPMDDSNTNFGVTAIDPSFNRIIIKKPKDTQIQ